MRKLVLWLVLWMMLGICSTASAFAECLPEWRVCARAITYFADSGLPSFSMLRLKGVEVSVGPLGRKIAQELIYDSASNRLLLEERQGGQIRQMVLGHFAKPLAADEWSRPIDKELILRPELKVSVKSRKGLKSSCGSGIFGPQQTLFKVLRHSVGFHDGERTLTLTDIVYGDAILSRPAPLLCRKKKGN